MMSCDVCSGAYASANDGSSVNQSPLFRIALLQLLEERRQEASTAGALAGAVQQALARTRQDPGAIPRALETLQSFLDRHPPAPRGAASTAPHTLGPGPGPVPDDCRVRRGWLRKVSGRSLTLQRRWAVLDGPTGCLYYYADESERELRGALLLRGATITAFPPSTGAPSRGWRLTVEGLALGSALLGFRIQQGEEQGREEGREQQGEGEGGSSGGAEGAGQTQGKKREGGSGDRARLLSWPSPQGGRLSGYVGVQSVLDQQPPSTPAGTGTGGGQEGEGAAAGSSSLASDDVADVQPLTSPGIRTGSPSSSASSSFVTAHPPSPSPSPRGLAPTPPHTSHFSIPGLGLGTTVVHHAAPPSVPGLGSTVVDRGAPAPMGSYFALPPRSLPPPLPVPPPPAPPAALNPLHAHKRVYTWVCAGEGEQAAWLEDLHAVQASCEREGRVAAWAAAFTQASRQGAHAYVALLHELHASSRGEGEGEGPVVMRADWARVAMAAGTRRAGRPPMGMGMGGGTAPGGQEGRGRARRRSTVAALGASLGLAPAYQGEALASSGGPLALLQSLAATTATSSSGGGGGLPPVGHGLATSLNDKVARKVARRQEKAEAAQRAEGAGGGGAAAAEHAARLAEATRLAVAGAEVSSWRGSHAAWAPGDSVGLQQVQADYARDRVLVGGQEVPLPQGGTGGREDGAVLLSLLHVLATAVYRALAGGVGAAGQGQEGCGPVHASLLLARAGVSPSAPPGLRECDLLSFLLHALSCTCRTVAGGDGYDLLDVVLGGAMLMPEGRAGVLPIRMEVVGREGVGGEAEGVTLTVTVHSLYRLCLLPSSGADGADGEGQEPHPALVPHPAAEVRSQLACLMQAAGLDLPASEQGLGALCSPQSPGVDMGLGMASWTRRFRLAVGGAEQGQGQGAQEPAYVEIRVLPYYRPIAHV